MFQRALSMDIQEIKRQNSMAEAKSIYRGARISPSKVRPLARLISDKKASDALNVLQFSNQKASVFLHKVLLSAVANVENNLGENADDFFVRRVLVDEGAVLKRIKIRARGRADRIIKRSCHITLILRDS